MTHSLFSEFEPVSAKKWKQKIQFDLKGADYNETLIWQSLEGIHVKPFYHREDATDHFQPIPGQPSKWNIAQHVYIDDETVANQLALNAIDRGAESIYFSSQKPFELEVVFQKFPFHTASIYFDLQFLDEDFIQQLQSFLQKKEATVYYNIDILGNLARSGNWYHNQLKDLEIVNKLVSQSKNASFLSVDTTVFQNAGANMVQQLAYGLAQCNEYFTTINPSLNIGKVNFKVAVGSNYFFEIAKIRALRKLYALLATEYGMDQNCTILAVPSKRNKTLYDYNINMLRTTTECMSAILGGADTICNLPYDSIYHKSNEFGERISRNQLLILKAESYFDVVTNPADGSYYIESLTQELAEKALSLFKEIEKNGGYLNQLKAGKFQKKIKESASKEQTLFDEGKLILVGTNKYQNKKDRMKDDLQLYPFLKMNPRQTAIAPVIEERLAENIEKQRLENE